jgi:hypothetical protein
MRFTFLNRTTEMIGSTIAWQVPGQADQLWRMNLHYMEYLESVDDATWSSLVTQWIDGNPPTIPGSWRDAWNSYALSLRLGVWLAELARRR